MPRDNVIFELGACMSRLGPKRTFILCPDAPEVVLPSYFHGIGRLTYEANRIANNPHAAVGSACDAVAREFANLDRSVFCSDLPAGGLAYGYFYNFLQPTYNAFSASSGPILADAAAVDAPKSISPPGKSTRSRKRTKPTLDQGLGWNFNLGFKLYIVIPEAPLNREKVQQLFTAPAPVEVAAIVGDGRARSTVSRRLTFMRLRIRLLDGRDITIYSEQRRTGSDPFHIFDVPTTLLTSREVISELDAFWGKGDLRFQRDLIHREGLSFSRTLNKLIGDKAPAMEVISMADFEMRAFQP